MQVLNYTAVIEFDGEAQVYVAYIPALPEAITQAATLTELDANLREVLELALEERAAHAVQSCRQEIRSLPSPTCTA